MVALRKIFKLAHAHDAGRRPPVAVDLPKDKTYFREVKGEACADEGWREGGGRAGGGGFSGGQGDVKKVGNRFNKVNKVD
jgi:hypothetical protein